MSVEEYLKRIEALKILGWWESYSPVDYVVLDGENWTVKYDDSENKTYKIEGDNAYPNNWIAFIDLMTKVAGYLWDYKE